MNTLSIESVLFMINKQKTPCLQNFTDWETFVEKFQRLQIENHKHLLSNPFNSLS